MFNNGKLLTIGPNIKTGPEFVPLKEFNTNLPTMVFVIDLKDDNSVICQGEINYANFDDRKWLGKVTFWAISNGYSVETVAKKDVEP